jgi:virginiamycin B lyase
MMKRFLTVVSVFMLGIIVGCVWISNFTVLASPAPSSAMLEFTIPTSSSHPYSVVTYGGKVYFCEETGNKIGILDPSAKTIKEWTVPTALAKPRGMTVDQGIVWFTEYGTNKVGRFNSSANSFTEWTISSKDGNSSPCGISVLSGKIYFTCNGNQSIGRLDPSTNKITEWNVVGTGTPAPWGVALDSAGKIWFTRGPTSLAGNVSKLDTSTNNLTQWALPDSGSHPWQITLSANGKIWFTESSTRNRVARLDSGTNKLTEWTIPTVGGKSAPFGVVEDGMGNIFFTASQSNQIGKLEPTGGVTRTIKTSSVIVKPFNYTSTPVTKTATLTTKSVTPTSSTAASTVSTGLARWNVTTANSQPAGIATEDGTVFYFAEYNGNKIAQFKPQYTLTKWTVATDHSPWGMALSGTNAWTTEYDSNGISMLNTSSNKLTSWDIPTAGSEPWGIAVASDGKIWFTEYLTNKIGRLDPATGKFSEWDIPTADSYPTGIMVSSDGKIWFTESWVETNQGRVGKIGRLDPATSKITEWTIPSSAAEPYELAISGKMVWYVDDENNIIGRLNTTSNKFTEWTMPTSDTLPHGIAISSDGKIWYSGNFNHKIGRLDPSTNKITEWIPSYPTTPEGIAVYNGKAWFTESNGNAEAVGKLYPTGGKTTSATPVSHTASPATATKTPVTTTKTSSSSSATVKTVDITGSISGAFTEWVTQGIWPNEIYAPGMGAVWFNCWSGAFQIGMLS